MNLKDLFQNQEHIPIPRTLPDYSSLQYWDQRYQREKDLSFEWLDSYEGIRDILLERLFENREAEVLILGCGNSAVGEGLYDEGYHYITNIDFSSTVIEQMQQKYKQFEEMDFQVMDVTDLEIEDDSVHLILDKATLDSVICSNNNHSLLLQMLLHVYRVLLQGGVYILLSHGKPETRLPYLQNPSFKWRIEIMELPTVPLSQGKKGDQVHYCYICTKDGGKEEI